MRIRNAVVTAAAAAVLPLGLLAVGGSAGAATPPCTPNVHNNSNNVLDCLTPFNQEFGLNYFWDVFHARARVGQPVILFQNSTHDGAEDFSYYDAETVCDYHAAGLVSDAVVLHYGGGKDCLGNTVGFSHPNDLAFEAEYTPYGVPTNLCVGVATTAAAGTPVSLQPCGVSAKTVWIIDWQESNCLSFGHHHGFGHNSLSPNSRRGHHSLLPAGYLPLINGSDTNFSHPFVLTYPSNGAAPWDRPRPQLMTANLTIFSNGTIFDNQMWGLTYSGPQQSFPPPCSQFFGHFPV